jgi:tetratricopeptide (TPR) repeat protein
VLTVSNLLGTLQEDPYDAQAIRDLRDVLAADGPNRADDLKLLRLARETHEARGEFETAAALLAIEIDQMNDPDAQAERLVRLGKLHREELLDDEAALLSYRAALQLRPGDGDAAEIVEQLETAGQNWKEIAKRFVDEAETTSEASLKTSLLVSAASFVWKYKKRGRDKDVDRLFRQGLDSDPGDARASRLYAVILRQREKWDELSAVLLDAAEKTRSREDRVQFYLQAARVISRRLKQTERAAACYERVLDFAPGHEEGMRYLVEYFTSVEQWDHLVALYEDALRSRHKLENEPGILLQVGMVHWRFRGAPEAAEPFFARLRKMDPAHPAMLGFYRDFLAPKAGSEGDNAKLVSVLTDAQRAASDPKQKAELSVELGKVAAEGGATDRAIDAWKQVLRNEPGNAEAIAALKGLYLRGEKWNALVEVLKTELDALPDSQAERKVALLRETIPIYRDHLRLDVMVINSYNAILALREGDPASLQALAGMYEQLGRYNDLISVLGKTADASSDPEEQTALYMRIGKLWIERFANYNQATAPLEQVLERDPKNREAITLLKEIYNKKRAFKQLFDVMKLESELASDPDARHQHRLELARIAGERLHRPAEAIPLWKEVLAHDPSSTEAVDALEKLAEREKDWPTVAEVIERRIATASSDIDRVKLLVKLGTLWGEQVGDAAAAASSWRRVIAIDPKNGRALRTLRESYVSAGDWDGLTTLYAETGDWDGLAEVLGNAAERQTDVEQKIALSYRAADVYAERLNEPGRAFRNYERILGARATEERALRSLIPIYEREEKWTRLPGLYEGLLAVLTEDRERSEVVERLRVLALDRLHDADGAMRWAVEGQRIRPDADTMRALEATAEQTGQWARVEAAYLARLEIATGDERASLRRRTAHIAATKLGASDRAAQQLRALLEERPGDGEAARDLDRLLRQDSKHGDLRSLYKHRIDHATEDADRWMLLHELAKLEENELGDKDAAASLYRRALEIDGSDRDALAALDRLAAEAGRDDELAAVLRRRRELSQTADDRLELTLRLGEVLGDRLRDSQAAEEAYGEVLTERPTDARAVAGMERLAASGGQRMSLIAMALEPAYEASGQWKKLEETLQRRLVQTTSPQEKRELRLRIASLAGEKNGDPAGAYQVLENAFLDEPGDTSLWDRLAEAAEASEKHADLATAFATAIEMGDLPADDIASLARRVAALHDQVLGKPEDAEPFHKKVLSVQPDDEDAFLSLKELFTNAERCTDLQELYRVRIAQTVDAQAKLDLLLQVCFLFEELTDDPAQAMLAYAQVLELDPSHVASRRSLDRLYVRTGKHRELADLLLGDLDLGTGSETPDDRAQVHARLGALYETELGEPPRALDHYRTALELEPTAGGRASEAARLGLERLLSEPSTRQDAAQVLATVYEQQGSDADVARMHEVQLEVADNTGSRIELLGRIAELHERLGDAESAFSARSRAFDADPQDPELRSALASGAIRAGRERDQAGSLERALAAVRGQPAEVEILAELAALFDGPLADVTQAEAAWARLFEASENDLAQRLEAARALERIHLGQGNQEKLAEDLRHQSQLETDPEIRGRLLVRLAELYEQHLGKTDLAVATHRERLELDPTDVDALTALQRLHEQRSEWAELITVLEQLDANASDDEERRPLARRIGAIYEQKLEDPERAIAQYTDVVARFGPDRITLSALIRLYDAADRAEDLLDVVLMVRDMAPEGAERASLTFHAAELMRNRTGEVERAIESYGQVLDVDSGHEGAVDALIETMEEAEEPSARWMAARVLRPRFEAIGDFERLFPTLDVLATSDDPTEKLDALRRSVAVAEGPLGQPSAAFDRAALALRAGLGEADAGHLVDDVERLAASSGRWADYAQLLEEVAPEIADGELSADALRKVAEVARERLGDSERARRLYSRVLEGRPDHSAALDALESIASESERWLDLLDVLKRKEANAADHERATLLLRQAEVAETKLNDSSGAIDAFDRTLTEPSASGGQILTAYQGLERLYAATQRWPDLASTYERMLETGAGSPVENRYNLGRVYRHHLGDSWAALEQFKEGMAVSGAHEGTLTELEGLMGSPEAPTEDPTLAAQAAAILEPTYLSRLAWPKVVAALEARLAGESEQDARKALLARLGQVHEEYLEDLEGAATMYGRLFREDPRDTGTWDTLSRLGRATDKWERVGNVFATTLEEIGIDDDATARLGVLAGHIHEERLGDGETAAALYRKVLAFSPQDRSVFLRLESLLMAGKRWPELLSLYASQAEVAESDGLRIDLLEKSARVEREELNEPDRAIDRYRAILDIEPTHLVATTALDALYASRARWPDLAEHLRRQADELTGYEQNEVRYRLGVLLGDKLEDRDGAIDTFEEITRSDPNHTETVIALERLVTDPARQGRIIEILDPIYQATDQWKKRIAIGEARLSQVTDAADQVRVLEEIARLHEERGQDQVRALEAWARAFSVEPGNDDVRGEVDRLAALTGDWNALVQAYEAAIAASTDAVVQSSLLNTVARIHDEKRGDPRAAIETYERLLELDKDDASPLDALEALHTMVGDWNGMVSVLERKVERAYDPTERGELLRRAGSVAEDLLGDRNQAVELYKRAVREDDTDVVALESLDRLHTESRDNAALAEVLKRRVELESDPDVRVDCALRLGRVAEEYLRDAELAIDAFQRALGDRPDDQTAVAALGRLYEREARWPDFLENVRLRAGAAETTAQRVTLLFRASEVLERELDDVPEALMTLEQVLALDPAHAPSIDSLVRLARLEEHRQQATQIVVPLLEQSNRSAELAQMLELMADSSHDPMEKRDVLRRLAAVHETGRRDLPAAFEALRRALAEDPSDSSIIDELERVGAADNAWERIADVLTQRAGSAHEPEAARVLYARAAQIAESRLGDDARAIDAHRRTLDHVPDDEAALEALDRLYAKRQDFRELGDILERRVQREDEPTLKAELLLRLGTLRWEQFEDPRGAFSAFQEVLERDPSEPRALGATEGLLAEHENLATEAVEVLDNAYRATGNTAKVAGLYDVRIKLADSEGEQVRLYSELATLRENELGDLPGALSAWVQAFHLDPRDGSIIDEAERLAGATGGFEQLRGLVEKATEGDDLDRSSRRELHVRAAGWYRDRLGDVAAAEAQLRAAITADRESSDAHTQLVELLRMPGREDDLVSALSGWAETELDETSRKDRLREAAALAESALRDAPRAVTLHQRILDSDGSDTQALDALIRLKTTTENWSEVATLLERRIDVEMDPETRVGFRRALAHVVQTSLSDPERAVDAWRAVLDEAPTDLSAMDQLEQLYDTAERFDDLEELVQRRLDVAETPAERIAGRVRLARLVDRLGRRSEAIEQLHDILSEDPQNADALDELESLLAKEKRWPDLGDLVARRIDDARNAGDAEAVWGGLIRMATLREEHLSDLPGASEALEGALAMAEDETILAKAARLREAQDQYEPALDFRERRLQLLTGDEAIEEANTIAELAESKLGDQARAERALRRAFEQDRMAAAPKARLVAFYEKHGRHAELAEVLRFDADAETEPVAKVALLRRVADLYANELSDPGSAAVMLEQASALQPDDRDVLLPLCDLYIAAGRQADAVPVLEKIIASYGTRRTKEIAVYQHRMGKALEGMGDIEGALKAYDAAFKIDLTNIAILRDLGRLCWRTGDYDRAQKTFRALLLQKLDGSVGITKGDIYFYLGDIAAKGGDPKKGIQNLERALVESPGHPEATALLAQLKG